MMGFVTILALGLFYIVSSSGLIAFNKYLMTEGNFPFAVPIVMMHMLFCSFFTGVLFLVRPSLFPSLTDPDRKVNIDKDLILYGALPIAVFFSITLVLSNVAYLHSSVAFLQMMKEANLVLVYVFSLVAVLERFSWRSVRILIFVIIGTTLTIHGELNFSMHGFLIQASSQVFECMKIVLQAMMLTGRTKLDVLSYVLIVSPLCLALLSVAFGALCMLRPNENLAVPGWSDIEAWWPFLLANASVAFLLNVAVAMFMKASSAVAYILAGIFKDAMIVLTGFFLLHEHISHLQFVGFGMQLIGILVWSLVKVAPDKFEDGVVNGLVNFFVPSMAPAPKCTSPDYGAVEDQRSKA